MSSGQISARAGADLRLPGLTKRVAEALKPFVDEALRLEQAGGISIYRTLAVDYDVAAQFLASQWRELLAALRESQREAERITGGVE